MNSVSSQKTMDSLPSYHNSNEFTEAIKSLRSKNFDFSYNFSMIYSLFEKVDPVDIMMSAFWGSSPSLKQLLILVRSSLIGVKILCNLDINVKVKFN